MSHDDNMYNAAMRSTNLSPLLLKNGLRNDISLDVYLAWVSCWLSTPWAAADKANDPMSLEEMASFFRRGNLARILQGDTLKRLVTSFRHRVDRGELLLGGSVAPSCAETNIIKLRYDPRVACSCDGLYPVPAALAADDALAIQQCGCRAVEAMARAERLLCDREDEWNPRSLFTARHLRDAVAEMVLFNADEQPEPETCCGFLPGLARTRAPDRRPSPDCDTELSTFHQLYPTNEQIKLLADAKYFFAIACAAGMCDGGTARAVSEAANIILIADYCEAADEVALRQLQDVGAAAVAFLKLQNLAGVISNWHFDNLVAQNMQFCVLGYHRDHSRRRRRSGVYGSRYTDLLSHRYIDLSTYIGVMNASIALGERLTAVQFRALSKACCYVCDLVDYRSDTMRKLRENFAVRGLRGNLCKYLDRLITECLESCVQAIHSSSVSALVVMAMSNWALMASQHKVYELLRGLRVRKGYPVCAYASASNKSYAKLLDALAVYRTLGENGPSVSKKRCEMNFQYHVYQNSPDTSMAWLADSMRTLLEPTTLRKLIDLVHYEWIGDVGDVEYCP